MCFDDMMTAIRAKSPIAMLFRARKPPADFPIARTVLKLILGDVRLITFAERANWLSLICYRGPRRS